MSSGLQVEEWRWVSTTPAAVDDGKELDWGKHWTLV
jgi:hypothetical protein